MKPRNVTLAVVLKNDPARLRVRVAETEPRKIKHSRARRKAVAARDVKRSPK